MEKKKILIFSLMYFPWVGGAEVAVKQITDRVSEDEFEFHMITLGADSKLPLTEKMGAIMVHRIGWFKKVSPTTSDYYRLPLKLNKWIFQFGAFFYALKLHKQNKFDGVWAIMAQSTGVPATLFKLRHSSVPFILTLQEGLAARAMKKKMLPVYPLYKLSFKKADVIQSISKYLDDFGKSMGFRGESRIIPNGVDGELFRKETPVEVKDNLRRVHSIKKDDIVLLHNGRLAIKNGVEDLIKALPLCGSHVKLLLVGDGPLKEELQNLAKGIKVADRVIFIGQKSYEQLPHYLSIAHIFIRPSLSEGFGNVFVEAMAARVPVIGTRVGGIRDFLFEGETGWVCNSKDPKSIAQKVHYIVNPANKNEVEGVLLNAEKMVHDKYEWPIIAGEIERLFKDYIGHVSRS